MLIPGAGLRKNIVQTHKDNFRHLHGLSLQTLLKRLKKANPLLAKKLISTVRRFITVDDMKVIGAVDLLSELFPCESQITQ